MYQARQLTALLQEFSIPLILGVVAGLFLANVNQHLYEELVGFPIFGENVEVFGHALTAHFLINEIFMVFFFGIATKEITESLLPGGALNPLRKAINPVLGTLGGVVGPASLYLLLTFLFYGGTEDFGTVANGWAIPTATDIALAWLVARLVFGNGHPAVNFLLLLAVADDGIGLAIIAVFYPDPDLPVMPAWLLLTVGGMGTAFAMRSLGLKSWLPYIVIGGALSWVGLLKASIEPALALVVIVPFLPAANGERGPISHALRPGTGAGAVVPAAHHPGGHEGPLERFEHQLKLFVDFGLFFFAFANAGVAFASITQVTFIVLISLIAGKTVGITLFSWVGTRLGFPLPEGMGTKHLLVASIIAGLGLTVALFVAGKAYDDPAFQDPAKMGAVLSAGAAIIAFAAGRLLKVKDGPDK